MAPSLNIFWLLSLRSAGSYPCITLDTLISPSTTQIDFDDAFDSFISRDCPHITVNGEPYTREDFKHALQDQKRDESWCKMKIKHAIESPTDSYHPREAGTVRIAYEALINVLHPQGSFNHTGHPQHRDVNSSLNLVISEDPTVRPEHQTCRGECCDIRRVSAIDQALYVLT
ncbi:hypothetical protein ABKN59_009466 [Abortiporus biennis]